MVAEIALQPYPQLGRGSDPPVRLEVVAELLSGLNREQRRAVTHGDGPQLVIAGPGTGKTEVVTRRVAWLIATRRARPREILALTFTDSAAQEMQARVDLLLPYGQADAQIHTFHALGDRLLREHAFELGLPGDVRLVNRAEAIVLLRDNLFTLGLERYRPLGDPTRFLGALVDLFGRAKEESVTPDDLSGYAARLAAAATDDADHDAARALAEQAQAYTAYQQLLGRRGLIDHGDQLSLPLRLLTERPHIRREVVARYRHVLVDEFQDMNRAQVDLLFQLTPAGRNVTVVGDLDQAVYTFRGAAGDNVRRFADAHPDLRTTALRRNYRSRRPIIEAATRLIDHGPRWTSGAREGRPVAVRRARRPAPVRALRYGTADEEADGVAQQIAERATRGERPRDFAVLVRSNAEIEPLARSLVVRGINVRRHSPSDFFAQLRVRPLLALLRFVADPTATLELYVLATAWPYELGGAPLTEMLAAGRRAHVSLWELMCRQADDTSASVRADGFDGRLRRLVGDLRHAIDAAHERSAGELLYDHLRRSGLLTRLATESDPSAASAVARFFEIVRARTSLLADARVTALVPHLDALIEAEDDLADEGPLDLDAVSLLTVHRAKGREFRIVFLTGLVEGRFPVQGRPPALAIPWATVRDGSPVEEDDRLSEERRLCYVAMTRARDELWLTTHASTAHGRARRRPSPFIAEALDLGVEKGTAAPGVVQILEPPAAPPPAATAPVARSAAPSFSFSQIEDYIDCPERYRLRYVVGLPTPPHHALTYGRALHSAVAWFHLQVAAGRAPSEGALVDEFRRAWLPEGFLSREHEEARFAAGVRTLREFRTSQLAQPAPVVAVERPFEVDIAGVRLRGRIDRIDHDEGGDVIVDYKSSDVREQRRADEKARDSLQLRVYAMAHQAGRGVLPRQMRLHFLDSGIVGQTAPDAGRLERAREQIAAAAAGIASAEFAARPNPVACGYCPFRSICGASAA